MKKVVPYVVLEVLAVRSGEPRTFGNLRTVAGLVVEPVRRDQGLPGLRAVHRLREDQRGRVGLGARLGSFRSHSTGCRRYAACGGSRGAPECGSLRARCCPSEVCRSQLKIHNAYNNHQNQREGVIFRRFSTF
jgi:hypothetical protein